MDQDGAAFWRLRVIFPKFSDAELKEGIFVGPQIRKVMKDEQFTELLNDLERKPGTYLRGV